MHRPFVSLARDLPCMCNLGLASIEKDISVSALSVDFSDGEPSLQMSELLTSAGTLGILEWNDYQSIELMFPFISVHIEKATG